MLSKAHLHMKKKIKEICKKFNITLLTEVREGEKRYDFYIPTKPPIVIEVDGINHQLKKADGFFFKTEEQLLRYKSNDYERNRLHNIGRIILFRFSDKEFPNIVEILNKFGDDVIEILKKGADPENAHFKTIIKNQEFNRRRKEQIREMRKKAKQ